VVSSDKAVWCDMCDAKIVGGSEVYHCTGNSNPPHAAGFDVCLQCAEIRDHVDDAKVCQTCLHS